MPAGAARNALDCALLDLEAKASGQRVWNLLGRPAPPACITAYTISLAYAGGDGGRDRQGRAPAAAQDQARRRRRRRADRGGAQGGPRIGTHRRRQRGLDIGQSRAKSRRLRRSRRHAGRAAAAGRPGSRRWRASAGRSRSAPTKACTTAPRSRDFASATMPSTSSSTRPVADRGAGDGGRGPGARI